MGKLSMCRICLVENVRMCVVTNKSLQEAYEKLAEVPFVTEDRKPMLACLFCCTRLKQCCQLQRQCVAAKELLAQMLSEDYEQKPLTNRGHLGFVGRFIVTPIEHISIVDDCQIGSDAIKQEPPDVFVERGDFDLQLTHLSEELKLENPDNSYPGVEDIPAHESESDSEDVPLLEMKTEAEEGQRVSKRTRRACVTRRAAVVKKPTLKRKLQGTIAVEQTVYVLSDSKIIQTTETITSESVARNKEPITTTSQSSLSLFPNVIQHPRIHAAEKPYKCVVCQRSFSSSFKLKRHIRVHTGENPFKCDVCQRSFSDKSNLKQHIGIHAVEKSYKCDVCQRSFSQSSTLKKHIRVHTDEHRFKCDVCQLGYNLPSQLKLHSLVHNGEKPYKCDVCQSCFTLPSTLKRHIRVHTGEKRFKCDVPMSA